MSFMTAPSFLQKIILIGILLTTVISACDLYLCARRKGKPYLSAVMQAIVFLLSAFLLVNLAVYVNEKEVEKYRLKVTGKPLLSGAEFWNTLTAGQPIEPNERIESDKTPMIRTDDGKVYSFERIEHQTDGKKVYEIVATDITRKYELSEDLSKKNKELAALNRRMRAYGENIQKLTSEKETLNAKIRIHDELGKLLLLTRKSLSEDLTPEAKRELLSAWKTDLLAMGSVRSEKVTDTYSGLYAAAKSVGVTLKITGRKQTRGKAIKKDRGDRGNRVYHERRQARKRQRGNRDTDGKGLVFGNSGDKQRRAAEIDNQRRRRIFFASAVGRA